MSGVMVEMRKYYGDNRDVAFSGPVLKVSQYNSHVGIRRGNSRRVFEKI